MTYNGQYAPIINTASKMYGLDPNLIASVIKAESGFNARATSSAGAMGLMQLMPATGRMLGVTDPYDPKQNINAGSKYLAQQIQSFGSIELGLAAYNAGPGNVRKYGGIPPFNETKNYVKKVMSYYQGSNFMPVGPLKEEGKINWKEVIFSPLILILAGIFIILRD